MVLSCKAKQRLIARLPCAQLHEVMEQQTVSVAKAGIISTLNARTSVLAAANPVGSRYNPRMSVIDNIQLPPSLLSRFDLIYLVLDKAEEGTDRKLARHLIGLFYEDEAAPAQVPPADSTRRAQRSSSEAVAALLMRSIACHIAAW